MRRRILSILVSISMALLLVPAAAFTAVADTAGSAATPSVTTFATKDQLMNNFAPKDSSAIGKLAFGKNSQGKTQEWYILGKDYGISGETGGSDDNVMIFAASPLISSQVFRENLTPSPVPYDKAWGDYNDNKVVTAVAVNHYGASDLRAMLNSIATDTNSSYFTAAEQGMMNSSSILTYEYYNGSPFSYNTTDVLYPIDRFVWFFGTKSYRVGASYTELDTCYAWDNGAYYWTRGTENEYNAYAFVVSGSSKTESLAAVHQPYAVRPAGDLNLTNVLFASAAEASDSGAKAGDIASGKAMTLRLDGSQSAVGSATYDAGKGVIVASAASNAASTVSLMVQGNDGTKDWYFSTSIPASGQVAVSAAQIKAATGASSVDLSACKIWVEKTDAGARMTYAVMAAAGTTSAKVIDFIELTGMKPTVEQSFPTTATCNTAGVSSTSPSITYTANGQAVTNTAAWNTTYTAEVTLEALSESTKGEQLYLFGNDVSVTAEGRLLSATFSPDKDGKLTVTCDFTTEKGSITSVVRLQIPANSTFTKYYSNDSDNTSPIKGGELGSVATVEYVVDGSVKSEEVGGVSWSFANGSTSAEGMIYDNKPGATNTFRWTIPAHSLEDFVVDTNCVGYDSTQGTITGTVEIANASIPVSITESSLDHSCSYKEPFEIDVSKHFSVDPNAGTKSYWVVNPATGTEEQLDASLLWVSSPGMYVVKLTTAPNGIYAAGEGTVVILVGERPDYDLTLLSGALEFESATYGYDQPAPQTITVANTGAKDVTLSAATLKYFEVEGLPTGTVAPGATVELSVQPKSSLGAGEHSETVRICATEAQFETEINDDSLTSTTGDTQIELNASFLVIKAKTALGLSASATSLTGGGTVELTVNTSMLPAGATYKLDCINDNEVAITAAGQDRYTVTLPNKTAQYTFRAYCSATANYESSASDHVFVDVTYLEPPSAPSASTLPFKITLTGETLGGSGSGSSSDVQAEVTVDDKKVNVERIYYGKFVDPSEAQPAFQGSLKLDLTNLGTPVTSTQFSKPAMTSLVSIATEPKNNVESVAVEMDGGTIELDRQALASIEGQMGSSVEMSVEQKGAGELTDAQRQALAKYGDMTTCVEASITSGRSSIHSFNGGSVSISVSFKPAEGADPGCYKVVYVAEDGSVEYYDAVYSDGKLSFNTSHLSTYAVVYVEPTQATLAANAALEALPKAGKLKAANAKAAVKAAKAALAQVGALDEEQRLLVDEELVANAEAVAAQAAVLVAKSDAKAVKKVKNKKFTVKHGKSKSIAFKTKVSAAGTKVVYKKASGSKYITVTKSGKVTAKKGMNSGKTYKAKVKVTCGEATRYVMITVKAK